MSLRLVAHDDAAARAIDAATRNELATGLRAALKQIREADVPPRRAFRALASRA